MNGSGHLVTVKRAPAYHRNYVIAGVEDFERLLSARNWSYFWACRKLGICPLSLMSRRTRDLFNEVMLFINEKILPTSGGFREQYTRFCQAYVIVQTTLAEIMEARRQEAGE